MQASLQTGFLPHIQSWQLGKQPTKVTSAVQPTIFRPRSSLQKHTWLRTARCKAASTSATMVTSRDVEQSYRTLPDGSRIEVLRMPGQENFMPYFSELGYDTWAISLRGQGTGDRPPDNKGSTLKGIAKDVSDFVRTMSQPPIILAHSFGGLAMLRYVAECGLDKEFAPIAGLGLLCSAPPSGNSHLVKRLFAKSWTDAIRLTWFFIAKSYAKNVKEARWGLFSEDIPQDALEKYAGLLKEYNSPVPLVDVNKIKSELPVPALVPSPPPILVLGAANDIIVDVEGIRETADFCRVEPVIIDGMAHDCMLDTRWRLAADVVATWLQEVENQI